jgi:hypothetical protein
LVGDHWAGLNGLGWLAVRGEKKPTGAQSLAHLLRVEEEEKKKKPSIIILATLTVDRNKSRRH